IVSGPQNGLRFGEFGKTNNSPTNVTVEHNNFGSSYANKALIHNVTNTLTANCNWFGSDDPAEILELISDEIEIETYSTSASPVNCDGVAPVLNTTQSLSHLTIQAAVDAANSGDIIVVSPGIYAENVVVT